MGPVAWRTLWIGNLPIDSEWHGVRVIEDEAEADPRYYRANAATAIGTKTQLNRENARTAERRRGLDRPIMNTLLKDAGPAWRRWCGDLVLVEAAVSDFALARYGMRE